MCRKINDREFQVQDDINQVNKLLASELRRSDYLNLQSISALSLAKIAYEMEKLNKERKKYERKIQKSIQKWNHLSYVRNRRMQGY